MATKFDVTTYHLTNEPKLYEPARSNNFEFIVPNIDTIYKAGIQETDKTQQNKLANFQKTLSIAVSSSNVPHFKMSSLDIKRGNSTIHYAGVPTFDNNQVVFNDYIGARTKDYLNAWKALSYDVRTEKVQTSDKYKQTCYLVEYPPDYSEPIRNWELQGCWVSELSEDKFDVDQNGVRKVTATIVYDRAIPLYDTKALV